jgi:glycosyltransferase involved in cell wall biosynthesis
MKKLFPLFVVVLFAAASLFVGWKKVKKAPVEPPYLTVFGPVQMADGIGRQAAELMAALKDSMTIGFVSTQEIVYNDVPKEILPLLRSKQRYHKKSGKVAIFEDCLWTPQHHPWKRFIRKTSPEQIRIAYSMFESTRIPSEWVLILNSYFDAVAVPDKFLIEVYRNSGVQIPIFELPLGLYLDPYFQEPPRNQAHKPMVFGNLSACIPRKNHLTLVRAFAKAFGNSKDVVLRMNCRNGNAQTIRAVKEEIELLGLDNIQFTNLPLNSAAYLNLFKTIDCYVSLAKSEGFSIQPREAMALGIPSIVTGNTAQTTICESGFVRAISSTIPEPADYFDFEGMTYGERFNCSVDEAATALLDLYDHYDEYLKKAELGRKWVRQYEFKNLKDLYLSLVKPKKVILGNEDKITEEYLMTRSEALYKKYLAL